MPHINDNRFFKWFYVGLVIFTFYFDTFTECRNQQQQQQHQIQQLEQQNPNNHNKNYSNNNNNINYKNNHNKHQKKQNRKRQQRNYHDSNESSEDINKNDYDIIDSGNNNGRMNTNSVDNHGHKMHRGLRKKNNRHQLVDDDISLWISEQQLQRLSEFFYPQGYFRGPIYAIENGHVLSDIRDADMYRYLTIPSQVNNVNFTWKSGKRKYYYHFDSLKSDDESILKAPTLSIKSKGRIPQEAKSFTVYLPCTGNNFGTAHFNVGLSIHNHKRTPLIGTPLRLNLKKECAHRGVYDSLDASNTTLTSSQDPDPDCSLKCGNNGICTGNKICQCKAGYSGRYCETPFCFPECLNGGNCTAPYVCTCPDGYQGTQCEGGICRNKCLNGGKCIQKDECKCSKGYFGLKCEYSKCSISCQNKGRCIGVNLCRCPLGFHGNHCEIGRRQRSTCKRPCKHGVCTRKKTCKCNEGFYGRSCNRRIKKHRKVYR